MRLLTSLLIAAGACSAQEQDFMSSIGTFVTSYKGAATLVTAVGGKVAHFVTSREADRQGKRVKISDQAANTAKYVVWRYAIASVGENETTVISNDNYKKMVSEGKRILDNKIARSKPTLAAVPAETTEDDKTPARRKLIKRVLPVAVASTALGVAAFK